MKSNTSVLRHSGAAITLPCSACSLAAAANAKTWISALGLRTVTAGRIVSSSAMMFALPGRARGGCAAPELERGIEHLADRRAAAAWLHQGAAITRSRRLGKLGRRRGRRRPTLHG
jgi:hypothetical protein